MDLDRLLQYIRNEYAHALPPPEHSPWQTPPLTRVVYNSPAPSICSSRRSSRRSSRQSSCQLSRQPSRCPSVCSNPTSRRRSSAVSNLIVIPDRGERPKLVILHDFNPGRLKERDPDLEDNESVHSYGTAKSSSISSVKSSRSLGGTARQKPRTSLRKSSLGTRSPRSCWFDDETDHEVDSSDTEPKGFTNRRMSQELLLVMPQRTRHDPNADLFDPNFSFERRCVAIPADKNIGPLQPDGWFHFAL